MARRDAASLQRGRNPAAPPGLAEPLTDRELEVLRLLAAGRSNQRITQDLVVALDTVKSTWVQLLWSEVATQAPSAYFPCLVPG